MHCPVHAYRLMARPVLVLLALLAAAAIPASANAQLRSLPPDSRLGVMRHVQGMHVRIDDRIVRLAAGAQIRDATNRIVLPVAVPPGSAVRYTLDRDGYLFRVWILSPQELSREKGRR